MASKLESEIRIRQHLNDVELAAKVDDVLLVYQNKFETVKRRVVEKCKLSSDDSHFVIYQVVIKELMELRDNLFHQGLAGLKLLDEEKKDVAI